MTDWQRKPGFDLSGKRALVVGFGNPAGRALALALAEAGADVAVASGTLDGDEVMAARRASQAIVQAGRTSSAHGWDVTLPVNVQVGLKQLGKSFGRPSILVYNADLPLARSLERTTDAEFARVQAVNVGGAFACARSFVRELPEDTPGRVIFVTSIIGERGVDHAAAYGAAKGGLLGLMTALSQEFGARGVTTNGIATGWMDWTPHRGANDPGENLLLRYIPLRRFGTAEDLAPLAVLLASDAAGYINGQVFHVDGGASGHL